jgi:DNA helicase-2/ATP-dependent DNA helicase PcrA
VGTVAPVASEDRLLNGLSTAQARAVVSGGAPLCVLAGAGSGKTRVLTRRIAWRALTGTASPDRTLALTFTRKAAGELRRRLATLGVTHGVAAGTFHSVALAQLRRRWADRGVQPPTLIERKATLLAPLIARLATSPTRRRAGGDRFRLPAGTRDSLQLSSPDLGAVATEIEWAKARMLGPEQYAGAAVAAGRSCPLPPEEMAEVFRLYEDRRQRANMVDFDDLLLSCAAALEEDAGFAAAQRWRFRHLFVDEFQDVNPAQYRLLRLWLGDRLDLCVVGDPHQAIYSWNGADPSMLDRFTAIFPTAEVVSLDDNYRSSPQVLAVAQAALGRGEARPLTSRRPDGPVPTVSRYGSDLDEARGTARRLRSCHGPGVPWSSFAVLARTNSQLVTLAEALRSAGVPAHVPSGSSPLDLPEVKAALEPLARAAGPFSVADLEESATSVAASSGRDDTRAELEGLGALGREYETVAQGPTWQGFLEWLRAATASDLPEGADAVELTTFHRSKGLEWPVVFVTGLERGLVPIGRAVTPAAEAEERRLLYVAMSRASRELYCSWAERRSFGARSVRRAASPYLERIEEACRALSRRADPAEISQRLSGERRRLGRAGRRPPASVLADGADPEVLESLRGWRATAARASGVPAYVVLHDSTLAALASRMPSSRQSLADVPGMGPVKVARYGDSILGLLREARSPG